MESMDVDNASNGNSSRLREDHFHLYPVSPNDSGEGLPYAPEDWPNPGDKWGWKVGRRIATSGYFLDRYLYPPRSIREAGRRSVLASKLSAEQFIQRKFPDADINAFFASFSWRVPSRSCPMPKDNNRDLVRPIRESAGQLESDSQNVAVCKAGNRSCPSLSEAEEPVLQVISCDLCCSEPGFCRVCCCILCCKIINSAYGGYNYIRCEANFGGQLCGHNAHIECAVRAYMAGTVGGSIGLDAEYYCRRCDSRTDLVLHVSKLLQTCETIDSRDDIEKILNVGISILRGSNKKCAKRMLDRIEVAMAKFKNGNNFEDALKEKDGSVDNEGLVQDGNITNGEEPPSYKIELPEELSPNFDYQVESLKLEDEIDSILDALRKSQQYEYSLAEERLLFQKKYLLNLYQQLDKERLDLLKTLSGELDSLLDIVHRRADQIKREVSKLKEMAQVANGFGSVPRHILKEHFGLEPSD